MTTSSMIKVAGFPGNADHPPDLAQPVVVAGNLCTDNREHGIHLSAAQSGLVASNYVDGNGKPKIFKDGRSTTVSVQANVEA